MTATENSAPFVLLVSRLGIDAGSHECRTLIGARRKLAALQRNLVADQGAVVANVTTPPGQYPAAPIEYLGRI